MAVYAYYDEFQASYTGEYPCPPWFVTVLHLNYYTLFIELQT